LQLSGADRIEPAREAGSGGREQPQGPEDEGDHGPTLPRPAGAIKRRGTSGAVQPVEAREAPALDPVAHAPARGRQAVGQDVDLGVVAVVLEAADAGPE